MKVTSYGIVVTYTIDPKFKTALEKVKASLVDTAVLESRADYLISVYGKQRGMHIFNSQLSAQERRSVISTIVMHKYADTLQKTLDTMIHKYWSG